MMWFLSERSTIPGDNAEKKIDGSVDLTDNPFHASPAKRVRFAEQEICFHATSTSEEEDDEDSSLFSLEEAVLRTMEETVFRTISIPPPKNGLGDFAEPFASHAFPDHPNTMTRKAKAMAMITLPKVWSSNFYRNLMGIEDTQNEYDGEHKDDLSLPSAFMSENKPTAGLKHEQQSLPIGNHFLQLYSMATPQGQQVTILLEELLAAGFRDAEYDAWLIDINEGDQFGRDFVEFCNPNSKVPALLDFSGCHPKDDAKNILDFLPWNKDNNQNSSQPKANYSLLRSTPKRRIFEAGSILLYLTQEKFPRSPFLQKNNKNSDQVLNWFCWQMTSSPMVLEEGGFGHYFLGLNEQEQKRHEGDTEHFINRGNNSMRSTNSMHAIHHYTMETKRQLFVLNQQLENSPYIAGRTYSIADIALFPIYGQLVMGTLFGSEAAEFLNVHQEYPNVLRWAEDVARRPAVKRGLLVNRTDANQSSVVISTSSLKCKETDIDIFSSPLSSPASSSDSPTRGYATLRQRHSASDIDQALLAASYESF